jgi:hypothetical protein
MVFMTETKKHQIDKKSWSKWSFYVDIIVFLIIALCIYILIRLSYEAGTLQAVGGVALTNKWLFIVADVAFLAVGLAWVFFELYRFRGLARRYW